MSKLMGIFKQFRYKLNNKWLYPKIKMYSLYKKDIWGFITWKRRYKYRKVVYRMMRQHPRMRKRVMEEIYKGFQEKRRKRGFRHLLHMSKMRLLTYYHNLKEHQYGLIGRKANKKAGNWEEHFFSMLEFRLDTVIVKARLYHSQTEARHFIKHKNISVNGIFQTQPSYKVKVGDCILFHTMPRLPITLEQSFVNRFYRGTMMVDLFQTYARVLRTMMGSVWVALDGLKIYGHYIKRSRLFVDPKARTSTGRIINKKRGKLLEFTGKSSPAFIGLCYSFIGILRSILKEERKVPEKGVHYLEGLIAYLMKFLYFINFNGFTDYTIDIFFKKFWRQFRRLRRIKITSKFLQRGIFFLRRRKRDKFSRNFFFSKNYYRKFGRLYKVGGNYLFKKNFKFVVTGVQPSTTKLINVFKRGFKRETAVFDEQDEIFLKKYDENNLELKRFAISYYQHILFIKSNLFQKWLQSLLVGTLVDFETMLSDQNFYQKIKGGYLDQNLLVSINVSRLRLHQDLTLYKFLLQIYYYIYDIYNKLMVVDRGLGSFLVFHKFFFFYKFLEKELFYIFNREVSVLTGVHTGLLRFDSFRFYSVLRLRLKQEFSFFIQRNIALGSYVMSYVKGFWSTLWSKNVLNYFNTLKHFGTFLCFKVIKFNVVTGFGVFVNSEQQSRANAQLVKRKLHYLIKVCVSVSRLYNNLKPLKNVLLNLYWFYFNNLYKRPIEIYKRGLFRTRSVVSALQWEFRRKQWFLKSIKKKTKSLNFFALPSTQKVKSHKYINSKLYLTAYKERLRYRRRLLKRWLLFFKTNRKNLAWIQLMKFITAPHRENKVYLKPKRHKYVVFSFDKFFILGYRALDLENYKDQIKPQNVVDGVYSMLLSWKFLKFMVSNVEHAGTVTGKYFGVKPSGLIVYKWFQRNGYKKALNENVLWEQFFSPTYSNTSSPIRLSNEEETVRFSRKNYIGGQYMYHLTKERRQLKASKFYERFLYFPTYLMVSFKNMMIIVVDTPKVSQLNYPFRARPDLLVLNFKRRLFF